MGVSKMGILDEMMTNAIKIKNKDYVEAGYIRIDDINPNMRWFAISFFFMVIALWFSVWYIKIIIVLIIFSLSRSYFRGTVKL